MGRKVNAKAVRIGVINGWSSKWFSSKNYIPQLRQDLAIRKFLMARLKEAGIALVDIERGPAKLTINAYVVKPGLVIGKSGAGIEDIKKELQAKVLNKQVTSVPGKTALTLNVKELDNPGVNAQVVLDSVIAEIERRVPFRRAMKQAIGRVEKAGAKGVKIWISGRLNGAEIARAETLGSGQLPLQTLRADIDYSRGVARTMYGAIGIKVWIYRGEVFNKKNATTTATASKPSNEVGTVVKAKKKPTTKEAPQA